MSATNQRVASAFMAAPCLPESFHLETVILQLTPTTAIEFEITEKASAAGWGTRPGVWCLYIPGTHDWTYLPWARWWVDSRRQVHALLVPEQSSPSGNPRLA